MALNRAHAENSNTRSFIRKTAEAAANVTVQQIVRSQRKNYSGAIAAEMVQPTGNSRKSGGDSKSSNQKHRKKHQTQRKAASSSDAEPKSPSHPPPKGKTNSRASALKSTVRFSDDAQSPGKNRGGNRGGSSKGGKRGGGEKHKSGAAGAKRT
jgi:hypothetical protein